MVAETCRLAQITQQQHESHIAGATGFVDFPVGQIGRPLLSRFHVEERVVVQARGRLRERRETLSQQSAIERRIKKDDIPSGVSVAQESQGRSALDGAISGIEQRPRFM